MKLYLVQPDARVLLPHVADEQIDELEQLGGFAADIRPLIRTILGF
jgi:hypothetical protein